MYISETIHHRIRIESPVDELTGRKIRITDLETNEEITHISHIDIHLDARGTSTADITYYEADGSGRVQSIDGEPVVKTVQVSDAEVAVSAWAYLPKSTESEQS